MKKTVVLICLIFGSSSIWSQSVKKVIQFSGVVVDADSLKPVPYAAITVKNTYHGTLSDFYGYFSFVALENDTIEFSSVGYKKSLFVIPEGLEDQRYSLIQMLHNDTIILKTAVIYPWPTREQFTEAFLNLQIPDDDLERARKNLARESRREMSMNMPMDGSMNFKNNMQNYQSRLYTAGQMPRNSLLDPIAWSKFVQAWKKGEFRRND